MVSLSGGSRDNVIPSQSRADIWVENEAFARCAIEEIVQVLQREFQTSDPGLSISVESIQVDLAYTQDLTKQLLHFFSLLPNGVQALSPDIKGLVQTSLNNAVLFEKEGHLVLQTSLRSSKSSQLEELADRLKQLVEAAGGSYLRQNDYPSWDFEVDSPLREQCLAVYKEVYGRQARYDAVHAGLECGFLKKALPECDMISYGPNIYDVHSTKEHLEIDSLARVWAFTKALLASMR